MELTQDKCKGKQGGPRAKGGTATWYPEESALEPSETYETLPHQSHQLGSLEKETMASAGSYLRHTDRTRGFVKGFSMENQGEAITFLMKTRRTFWSSQL